MKHNRSTRILLGLLFVGAVLDAGGCGGGNNGGGNPSGGTPSLQSIQVSPANSIITAGGTQQFTATGTFSGGLTGPPTSVTWSSSATTVATISASGLATGVNAGSTTITATSGSISGSTMLATTNGPIAITPASPTVFSGTMLQLHASAPVGGGSSLDVTNLVTWSTPPNSIYSVSAGGLLTTSATQTGTGPAITASLQAVSGTTKATTTAGPDGLFVFRSPFDNSGTANFGNTVLVLTTSPRLGTLNPGKTFDPNATLDLVVAQSITTPGNTTAAFVFRATFATPIDVGGGVQNQVVTLRLIQGNNTTTIAQYTYVTNQIIPPAAFANNITFPGDAIATGRFIAGMFDDPAFFDGVGASQFLFGGGALPRTGAADFFGPKGNCLALILEVPTVKLTTANPPLLSVWGDFLCLFNSQKSLAPAPGCSYG